MNPAAPPGFPPGYAPDLISALAPLPGLFISQSASLVEAITGCDTNNKYAATAWNPALGAEKASNGKYGETLFAFREKSNCLIRQCLGPARPFKMAVYAETPRIATFQAGTDPWGFRDALVLERPFRCTFLCWWRSKIRVRHGSAGYLGEIVNPFSCFNPMFTVGGPQEFEGMHGPIAEFAKADAGKLHYVVRAECCQWGMWAPPLPFGPCRRVVFNIFRPDDTGFTKPVGSICKVFSGCLKEAFTVADNFSIAFPSDASPVQKALLMACVMLIDFLFFENTEKANNNSSSVLNMLV